MTENLRHSDEHLNAFVDNQLDKDETSQMLKAISADQELSKRTCEINLLKGMVQHAYHYPPESGKGPSNSGRGRGFGHAVAATLLLSLGGLLGWFGHTQQPGNPAISMQMSSAASSAEELVSNPTLASAQKVLLHLSEGDEHHSNLALSTAEKLLRTAKEEGRQLFLEVVANAEGLSLLRSDTSPYAERIRALRNEFSNIAFIACQNSINRLKYEKGIDAQLLPEAEVTNTAIDRILNRLNQGWVYLSV